MNRFDYVRPTTVDEAVRAIASGANARFIAGGTNLVDLMKYNVERPERLVDITRLPLDRIEERDGGLSLGALVTNSTVAYDDRVKARYPLLSSAILAGASGQLRNAATTGGNLLQRTRCYYFYDDATPCNKREPGTGCAAIGGVNRIHAIFGTSPSCIATHPSDMCVALAALEATVRVAGPGGERAIPFADFHRLPGDAPERDTTLGADEIVLSVDLPDADFGTHHTYLKLRDRLSYAFALVSVAAVMRLPREDRSLDALRTMLGMADAGGIGARLEKWTSRGAMGWVFDNAADEMTLDARFIGFDMTDFLDNAEIRAPLMLYLFHRIDKMLTGERTIIAIDEFWKALQDEAFRGFAQDGLKTYRKRNAMMVFATQSPADALKSDIAHSILEQVATQVMLPNPKGARRDYVEGFSLTEAEYQLIREELSPESRKFLVKQGHDSVVVELDLTGLDDELAVLSGRAETTSIAVAAAAEFGPDPAAWLPVFHKRRRPS